MSSKRRPERSAEADNPQFELQADRTIVPAQPSLELKRNSIRQHHHHHQAASVESTSVETQLDHLEYAVQKSAVQKAASALSSMKAFMKQTEKFYKEKNEALSEPNKTPVDFANDTILHLTEKLRRRENTITELRKLVCSEMLHIKSGGGSLEDSKTRMVVMHKNHELKILDLQEEVLEHKRIEHSHLEEISRLKTRLRRDNSRMGEAMAEFEKIEMIFKSQGNTLGYVLKYF